MSLKHANSRPGAAAARAWNSGNAPRLVAFGMCACLLLVAVQSARIGIAGLIVELGQKEVERWSTPPRPRSMGEINRVARFFTDSLEFAPDNPWALERLGALDLARMRQSKIQTQALAYAWAARLRYRQALRQRPTSPFLWANLALSKLYLDEFDDEFFTALRQADLLGPWEPDTQQTVLYVGLAAWDRLDATLQKGVVALLRRGAVRNAAKMLEIVKSFGRWDLVCSLKDYHREAAAACAKQGYAASGPGNSEAGNR